MRRKQAANQPCCSFCHQSKDTVGKLISSPSDSERVYICDECVIVCNSILEDDGYQVTHPVGKPTLNQPPEDHRWLQHPMASELLTAVENWNRADSAGSDAVMAMNKISLIVLLMTAEENS